VSGAVPPPISRKRWAGPTSNFPSPTISKSVHDKGFSGTWTINPERAFCFLFNATEGQYEEFHTQLRSLDLRISALIICRDLPQNPTIFPAGHVPKRILTMQAVDGFAKFDGGEISYRNTGAPDAEKYRTFIFVHGVASNKRTS
jgi:hypothetical protein